MLKGMDPVKISVNFFGEKRYLLYNMNAVLYLEYTLDDYYLTFKEKSTKEWTFDDTIHYFRAMMLDSFFDENEKYISARNFEKCRPSLAEIGRFLDLNGTVEIQQAIIEALISGTPVLPEGAEPNFQQRVQKAQITGL